MEQNKHIIQQQNIEIHFENFSEGISIQNDVADLFYEKILPKMETLFDEMTGENYLITVENVEIDCGVLNSRYWKEELVEETTRRLRQELLVAEKKEIRKGNLTTGQSIKAYNVCDSFLFFLQKGYLAWNSRIRTIQEMEEMVSEKLFTKEILSEEIFIRKLKELFQTEPAAIERLVYNFSEKFFNNILEGLTENKKEIQEKIYLFLNKEKLTGHKKFTAQSLLLKVFSGNHPDPEQQFYSLLKSPEKIKPTKKTISSQSKNKEIDYVYIQNAGLVILHPFLTELFTRLELLVDKHWKDISSQHKTVHVLEFLVSGKEEFPEFNLPLNKILCGLDISDVLQPVEELHPSIKSECQDLLSEVIRHWSILKNTSIDGLRETFLQRNGKLTQVENGWLLNVQQKGVDVLLNSLPWGIGVIKFPWMDDKFFVEWV